jgi:hypothetical protein
LVDAEVVIAEVFEVLIMGAPVVLVSFKGRVMRANWETGLELFAIFSKLDQTNSEHTVAGH